ncbi:uncharacterized protein LOC129248352 isoform X1 [Anastrepha obliqua]|uniref:uncharacterized protein LOC129248352 isoform X1 n=1 Tax=Anastrepha obliqua TaxID=95512 RepID=UPI00240A03EF|nr:uncharacterized protein LOC129248352 isoform X1 [Anastrepha obliqua]XP_054743849.1 uncharacterized protein LOC129248352 isoform X1 [Anastrepha obliqua]XP_054743850.1 uncharacterized protein LOC129248352 isoform X1 [Anastrepha obliqua]
MANQTNTKVNYTFQGFKWSRNTTLLLISLIGKNYNQLQSGVKKFTFQQIAQEINEQLGTNLAFDQVESKWKGLRRTYKKVKESNTQLSWEFYNVVDEILQDDIEINPLVTATSEEAFVTGCETEFDFIEYSVEPERSLFQQSRERGPSNDEDRYSREMRVGSGDEDYPGRCSRRHRISYEDRSGRIGRMHRSSDEDRRYRQIRKRGYSDDGQSGYETRRLQGNRNRIENAEAARERRHQEKMKLARKFLALFEKMVEKM